MKARLRVISAAVALATGIAAPALAQEAEAPASPQTMTVPPASSSEAVVGPAQLRDFSLQGTVTRRAETPPQPQPPQAVPSRSQSVQQTGPVSGSSAAAEGANRSVARTAPTSRPAPDRAESASAAPIGLPTPDQTLSFSPATVAPEPAIPDSEPLQLDTATTHAGTPFISHWPWLLALIAALGAAIWYFRRQRSGYAFAGASGNAAAFELSPPEPAPPPRAQPRPAVPRPVAAPAPAPLRAPEERAPTGAVVSTRLKAAPQAAEEAKPVAPPLGIISTRLRPWLDIEFAPLTASFNDQQGVIQFDVTLFNSGSAPARDILLEARLFNAGTDQDEAIERFFANPVAEGDRLEIIQPLQRLPFRTSATVPRQQMRIFEAGGRKVWVPLIGFNAIYRWSGGDGQTSASYLLGRNTRGEKMAPFWVDQGGRTFGGLGGREHHVRVRR